MASSTLTNESLAAEEKEHFTPTVPEIKGELCDACGGAVSARYQATSKANQSIFFCAHHIRSFAPKLTKDGFSIFPEDISYEAGVKVQA
jgi:hypothetical protein